MDYDERTALSVYRLGIGNIIGLIGVLVHSAIVSAYTVDEEGVTGYRIAGFIFGVWMTTAGWATFVNIKESFNCDLETEEQLGFFEGLKIVFQNRAFLIVVAIYLCGPTAVSIVQTNMLLYVKYVNNDVDMMNTCIMCIQGAAIIMMPFWNWVGQKWGKKAMYYLGGTVLMCAFPVLYFFEVSGVEWSDEIGFFFNKLLTKFIHKMQSKFVTYGVSIVAGTCISVPYVIPYSMLPDVIEEDERRTGKRREGIYFGFFTVFLKVSERSERALMKTSILAMNPTKWPHTTMATSTT